MASAERYAERRCGYRAADLALTRACKALKEAETKLFATRPKTLAGLVAKAKAFRVIDKPDCLGEDRCCFNDDIIALAATEVLKQCSREADSAPIDTR